MISVSNLHTSPVFSWLIRTGQVDLKPEGTQTAFSQLEMKYKFGGRGAQGTPSMYN